MSVALITTLLNKYRTFRFKRFLDQFNRNIRRYEAMMRNDNIPRHQRRRWKHQLLNGYKITYESLTKMIDNK